MAVRWAQASDRQAVFELMKAAGVLCAFYTYEHADLIGRCLVDEKAGELRGALTFRFGRPTSWIDNIAVRPGAQKHLVLANLMAALIEAATAHGSEGVEGFEAADTDPAWLALSEQRGAHITRGFRVRHLLTSEASARMRRWRARRRERTAT